MERFGDPTHVDMSYVEDSITLMPIENQHKQSYNTGLLKPNGI